MGLVTRADNARSRPNLVIVRAGDGSLHNTWARDLPDSERTWDLLVSFFGDDEATLTAPHEYMVRRKGRKYGPIFDLWKSGDLPRMEHVWLPDDDVETSFSAINSMFEAMRRHHLAMAQPALSEDSFVSHDITRARPHLELRWTSFVEVMCPLFSRAAFERVVPTFEGAVTGWGLDFVWPALLGRPRNAIAILDSVVVKHRRPIAATYDLDAAVAEKAAVLRRYDARQEMLTHACLPREEASART